MNQLILCIPFVVVLLCLSILPLLAPTFWHKRMTLLLLSCVLISIFINFIVVDHRVIKNILHHAIVYEYLPFVCTIASLYVISSNILIDIDVTDNTVNNALFLVFGGLLSSFIGTTGSSMLLIRPFLQMNSNRPNKAYMVVFFILIISNVGGLLTPLGDPPLFVGYLNGIPFDWTMKNLFSSWCLYVFLIVGIFCITDRIYLRSKRYMVCKRKTNIQINGVYHFILLIIIVLAMFISGIVLKNFIVLSVAFLSVLLRTILQKKLQLVTNYEPVREVTVVFLSIFITISPVMYLLQNNAQNISIAISKISDYVSIRDAYYWMCGLISSVLDNAPSYLLFFNIAGGAEKLISSCDILRSISVGSVVMGSLTYIGNAPNMMVRSVASAHCNARIPGFFRYMLLSCLIIIPVSFFCNYIINNML